MGKKTLLREINGKLGRALLRLDWIEREVLRMSQTVDNLVAQVAAQRTVIDGTKTLLSSMWTQLQGALDTGDLQKVQTALDDLKAQDAELAKAVVDNTPAARTPPPSGAPPAE